MVSCLNLLVLLWYSYNLPAEFQTSSFYTSRDQSAYTDNKRTDMTWSTRLIMMKNIHSLPLNY